MSLSSVPAAAVPPAYAEYLSLSYRPDLRMVVLRWLRDASLPEVQLGHQAALHLAQQHGAAHWFVDVRRRVAVHSSHTRWIIDDFLPQAATLLPAPLRIGYLMSPSRQNNITERTDLQEVMHRLQLPTLPYSLRAFLDESSAMAWLFEA